MVNNGQVCYDLCATRFVAICEVNEEEADEQ